MKVQDIVEDSALSRNTRSNVLSRALRQAYAQFPTAKNDTEAFASWTMSKQNAADELIDRQADLNRRQDAVIKSLDADNADQEQKLQALDQENDELSADLDQIEKHLDMPKKQDKEPAPVQAEPAKAPAADAPALPGTVPTPQQKPAVDKKSTLPATTTDKQLPGAQAFNTMVPHLGQKQKELPLDVPAVTYQPTDNVLEPTIPQASSRFKRDTQNATDVEPKYYANIAKNIASDPEKLRTAMGVKEGDNKKSDQPEADYGDDYQQMVLRLKKLAGMGPLKTVYDPAKRVYKNVPRAVQPGEKK